MSEKPITAIIIEDEAKSLAMLKNLLKDYVPEVEIIGSARSVSEGKKLLKVTEPDILFLDIAMPDGSGFEILDNDESRSFEVIFTTAYNEYSLRAFDFSALNYLLKPISSEDLIRVIDQYHQLKSRKQRTDQWKIFRQTMEQQFDRIALPTQEGLEFIPISQIIRCEAHGGYTMFYLAEGQKVMVSKSLNHYERLLFPALFYRVHHKHLVNLKYIRKYIKGSGGYVILEDGQHIDVSVRRKEGFLQALKTLI